MLLAIQAVLSLLCLTGLYAKGAKDNREYLSLKQDAIMVNSYRAYMSFQVSGGVSYRVGRLFTVGDNGPFTVLPNTMDLDSALYSYQCETPTCRAQCQGEGLRQSLSTNFTTNGTLFNLDQTYQSLEGVRSRDTFIFNAIDGDLTYLSNVTFMDAFYVYSKEQINPNLVDDVYCTVGNGTFGFGRGLKGVMGPTLMARFIDETDADMVYVYYTPMNFFLNLFVSGDITFTAPSIPIYYPNLIDEWPLWTLPITNVQFGSFPLGANGIAVIDAASSYLRMPVVYSNFFAQQLAAIPQITPEGVLYTIPNCDRTTLPNITISLAGDPYILNGFMYAYPPVGTNCLALFLGSDPVYDDTPIWRLGAPFLSAAFAFLNYTSETIGLIGRLS